jgi:hypothetical protein
VEVWWSRFTEIPTTSGERRAGDHHLVVAVIEVPKNSGRAPGRELPLGEESEIFARSIARPFSGR